jgi:Ca-activated chloride channel family protein
MLVASSSASLCSQAAIDSVPQPICASAAPCSAPVTPSAPSLGNRPRRKRRIPPASGRPIQLTAVALLLLLSAIVLLAPRVAHGQEDPLSTVHVAPPPPTPPPADQPAPVEGKAALKARAGERIRVDVNLVLIPLTVTDPMDRLVTGLEKENFFIYENSRLEALKSFSSEDAPVSIGVIFDLSGSMANKVIRARDSILQFMKTSNPQDEFFVVGFNDRPELIEDFTSSTDEIEARLSTVKAGRRTALLDAIYFGLNKMKQARYERKALLIVSDGGDNRSRYTEDEVRSVVRESGVQIYSIGIFDPYAATTEERLGPLLLNDISDETGGRLFRVDDIAEMGDIATKISSELRHEYVLGYKPTDEKRDGKWRKVKVKLAPPAGLPPLTVHARNGYYAPLQ